MDYKKEQTGVSVWTLFEQKPTRAGYETLRLAAQKAATAFEFRFLSGLTTIDQDLTHIGKNKELDDWVESAEGKQALVALTQDLQARIRTYGGHALPAHDLRQILYKDASEGLRFAAYEKPQGYKSSFIVPMFSHDIGRLLEGHLYQLHVDHKDWIPHSQLSFLMMRDVLADHPEIPQALQDQFMYAVLAHSGSNAQTYIGRAVQTCDRMQLIGPEGYFRAVSYVAGLMGGNIAYPKTQEYQLHPPTLESHNSAIAVLEHFGRNGYANIGETHFEWQHHMQMMNTAILLRMAEHSHDLGQYMLAPEVNAVPRSSLGENKKPLNTADAQDLLARIPANTNLHLSRQDLFERMVLILQAPIGAAHLPDDIKANIRAAVMRVEDEDMAYVQQGMLCSHALQAVLDRKDDLLIDHILHSDADPLISVIARQASAFRADNIPTGQALRLEGRMPSHP